MRRSDKEIINKSEIEGILQKADSIKIAIHDEPYPYIVPMNFSYREDKVYFHSANEGKKINLITGNNQVAFEADIMNEVKSAEEPCRWGFKYKSVIGYGRAHFVDDLNDKKNALLLIMEKYSGKSDWDFPAAMLEKTRVVRIDIDSMTGKSSGW
jgi:uncharacterized protein